MYKKLIVIFLIVILTISGSFQVSANLLKENENTLSALSGYRVMILVVDDIYNQLSSKLDRFAGDIEKEGYVVEIHHNKISTTGWKTPQKVRQYIKSHSEGLAGCILVGHIPMPQYKIKGYMNEYETFPCDYYYMDLDGTWELQSENYYNGFYYSIFKNHTAGNGDLEPEIWVGRITPDKFVGDEVELLKDYFDRNHNYRTGSNPRNSRALLYIDDAWSKNADDYKVNLKKAYPSSLINVVNDDEKTRKKDYMEKVKSGNYEWVELHAHSNNLYHQFIYSNGGRWDSLNVWDLRSNFTDVIFFVLYSCEALDYHLQCLGNLYLFGQTAGLVVIGSSKIGGLNDKGKHLYTNIGNGLNIGDSFKIWFTERGLDFPSYCMGMMIFGDPTLKPLKDTNPPNVEITFPEVGGIYFFGRELMRITPNDKYDSIVIDPMDLIIHSSDGQSKIKDVNVIFDDVRYSAEDEGNGIWSYPIINYNEYLPEIHTYQAEAKDTFDNIALSNERKICSIMGNSPPFLCEAIEGPNSGKTGNTYNYSIKLFDVEGDDVYYRFNWGDGTESEWKGPIETEIINPNLFDLDETQFTTVKEEHEFEKSGNHKITVEIKDENENLGLYEVTLDVEIQKKSRIVFIQHFFELLKNWDFPFLTKIFKI